MFERFQSFVQQQQLIQPGATVLLAVSGGIDSIVLSSLFAKSDFPFAIAHCNFGLRGQASNDDAKFVKEWAERLGVTFHEKNFDVEAYAKENSQSIQLAARDLRYAWFDKLCNNAPYDHLATAHHLNDQVETLIFNLTKGTGLSGLHGIPVKRKNIIRPLLFATREEVEAYAQQEDLNWRHDQSNDSLKYSRNKLRHEVIPVLQTLNPNLEHTMTSNIERFTQAEDALESYFKDLKEKFCSIKNGVFYIPKTLLIKRTHSALLLHSMLSEYGFNFDQCKNITQALDHTGAQFFTAQKTLTVDRTHIIVSDPAKETMEHFEIKENQQTVSVEGFSLFLEILEAIKPNSSKNSAFLDASLITYPLELRQWQQGDYFYPLGMTHKKKVSDFMIDEKIPLNLKRQQYVLCSNKEIIWVIGQRIDNRYKITPSTKAVLKIEIKSDKSI